MPYNRSICSKLLCGKTSMGRNCLYQRFNRRSMAVCGDFNEARYVSEKRRGDVS